MRKLKSIIFLVLFFVAVAQATPVPVSLVPQDFEDLLGGAASPVGSISVTEMSVDNLEREVVSKTFTDGQDYAYLYQVNNTGTSGNNAIESFTCSLVAGASGSSTIGYLTGNIPSGFTSGEQLPAGASVDPHFGTYNIVCISRLPFRPSYR